MARYTEPATKPRSVRKNVKRDGTMWAALGIGIVIGFALAGLVGIGLYGFGALPIIEQQYLPAPTCPPAELLLPVCPTLEPKGGAGVTPEPPTATETPTLTETPDLAATATVACATFSAQFPATPCP